MWELESAAPPADPEARQIQITLAQSRPRYVSPDLEFAVWTATIGESREGEPVTVTGPLGHVTAGEQLVCTGAFSQHPSVRLAVLGRDVSLRTAAVAGGDRALVDDARARDRPDLRPCDRRPLRGRAGLRRARPPAGAAA